MMTSDAKTPHQFGFNTRQLHAGQDPDPTTGSALSQSTRPPLTRSKTATMPPDCLPCRNPATSTPGS